MGPGFLEVVALKVSPRDIPTHPDISQKSKVVTGYLRVGRLLACCGWVG